MAQDKTQRVNHEITAPELRLVGIDSEQLGIVSLRAALAMAEESGVDLVE
ncbi:MAG: translation initiation factor IF-3, partial [Betaproteobacteria bacterium]|nr:translation initiation factor IF-3 [Betaproteobacteria bacterium]